MDFIAGRGKERGWIKEYLGDNLHNDKRKEHWRKQKIMWNRAIKTLRVKHRWRDCEIPGKKQSSNSQAHSPSFQQSVVNELITLSIVQFNGCSCFVIASSYDSFFISHMTVLTALLYLLHLYMARPQIHCRVKLCFEFSTENSVIYSLWSGREQATPLSLVLVWPVNQVGYSWKNHRVSVSY